MTTWKELWPNEEPTVNDVMKEAYHLIETTDIQKGGLRAIKRAIKPKLFKFFSGTEGILYINGVLMNIGKESELDG